MLLKTPQNHSRLSCLRQPTTPIFDAVVTTLPFSISADACHASPLHYLFVRDFIFQARYADITPITPAGMTPISIRSPRCSEEERP